MFDCCVMHCGRQHLLQASHSTNQNALKRKLNAALPMLRLILASSNNSMHDNANNNNTCVTTQRVNSQLCLAHCATQSHAASRSSASICNAIEQANLFASTSSLQHDSEMIEIGHTATVSPYCCCALYDSRTAQLLGTSSHWRTSIDARDNVLLQLQLQQMLQQQQSAAPLLAQSQCTLYLPHSILIANDDAASGGGVVSAPTSPMARHRRSSVAEEHTGKALKSLVHLQVANQYSILLLWRHNSLIDSSLDLQYLTRAAQDIIQQHAVQRAFLQVNATQKLHSRSVAQSNAEWVTLLARIEFTSLRMALVVSHLSKQCFVLYGSAAAQQQYADDESRARQLQRLISLCHFVPFDTAYHRFLSTADANLADANRFGASSSSLMSKGKKFFAWPSNSNAAAGAFAGATSPSVSASPIVRQTAMRRLAQKFSFSPRASASPSSAASPVASPRNLASPSGAMLTSPSAATSASFQLQIDEYTQQTDDAALQANLSSDAAFSVYMECAPHHPGVTSQHYSTMAQQLMQATRLRMT